MSTPGPRTRKATRARLLGLVAVFVAAVSVASGVAGAARAVKPGSLDPSFGHGGITTLGAGTRLFGTAVQSDGKVVAVGESGVGKNVDLLLARFTSTGRLDRTFGRGGLVHGPAVPTTLGKGSLGRAVAIQPNGRIVVVGKATSSNGFSRDGLLIERFKANGSTDSSFGSHGVVNLLSDSFGDGYAVAVQPDGKIVATGSDNASGSGGGVYPRVAVVRLKPGGGLDTSFSAHGIDVIDLGAFSYALAVALERNGKIVVAGSQAPGLQVTNALIAQLTPSGALDRSFDGTGSYAHQYARGGAFSSFDAVAVPSGGRIVAAGSAITSGAGADAFVARFSASGHQSGGTGYTPSATHYVQTGVTAPGAAGVAITRSGLVVATGEIANGADANLAVWAFTPGDALDGGFATHGIALMHLSSHANSEGAAVAVEPDGTVVAAGDESPPGSKSYSGLVASYGG